MADFVVRIPLSLKAKLAFFQSRQLEKNAQENDVMFFWFN